METIQDYEILEKIGDTPGSLIYRCRKIGGKETVVLKILKAYLPSPSEIARFKQEFEIIKSLNIDGVIKTYEVIKHESGFVIVLEDFEVVSIDSILSSGKTFDIKNFLNVSIKISETLGKLHKNGIIHKDIKPRNILINQDGKVKITGFGISSLLTHENEQIYKSDVIQGSLLYMSPEQTGRMNRMIDYRTDFYSLGATFYRMITGSVLFESKDPLEIIHSHIAKEPVPPIKRKADVPQVISEIIMKLLSKNADDRYQNAFGLMADLKECLEKLDSEGRIKPFELARHDISGKFILPQKLFGRETELEFLKSAFDRISGMSSHGTDPVIELILVVGNTGIGKSVLINEISKPVIEKKGYFLSGKFERFRMDKPYSAIVQAFQKLLEQILTESDEKIQAIKKYILEALGPNGKVITDIISKLELIIGKQPEVPKLGPNETRNRFNIVFKKFVEVFAKKEHPIVLFLDDLQRADLASLQLIKNLVSSSGIKYLLIIGSYRQSEISESHPLTEILKDINQSGIEINKLILSELTVNNINELLVNFLKCSEKKGLQLAELIYKKTGGNPFFIKEFLLTLHNEKLLEIDTYLDWNWDIERIKEISITDNVVEFLSDKINRLPERIKEVLKICACIGNRFDLETISLLFEKSIEETLSVLDAAVSGGFITISENTYTFIHERIQEAAYRLLSEKEKPLIHYRAGKLLLERTEPSDLHNKLFYIVDQLNLGSGLITDKKELQEIAMLNCESGIKAKTSGAYLPAIKYFETGMSLLEDKCWGNQYDLALYIYTEAAETAYLKGDYDKMNHYASIVIDSARNIYDTIPVYETKIRAHESQLDFKESIDIALDVLKKLNYPIPQKYSRLQIQFALMKIKLYLSIKKIDSLIELPEMTNPRILAISQMLSYITKIAYFISPSLSVFIPVKLFWFSIKYGLSQAQASGYPGMSNNLISVLGDIEAGYKLGNLTLKLVKKINLRAFESRIICLYNLFTSHWKEHLKSIRPEFMKSYYIGMETGDLESTSLSINAHDQIGINIASELTGLEQQMAKNHKTMEQLKQAHILSLHSICWQMVLNLLGRSESPTDLTGMAFNEEEMIPLWKASNGRVFLGRFYIQRLMLRYIFADNHGAMADSDSSVEYLDLLRGHFVIRDVAFFSSLIRLALYPEASKRRRREYEKFVGQSLKKFRKWARHAPMNNEQRIQLIEAEKARVLGKHKAAEAAYDRAIELSRKNEYLIEEAIANELAGRYYISTGRKKLARAYIQDAYTCYAIWGALAKLKHLQETYPEILSQIRSASSALDSTGSSSTAIASDMIDLRTVIKASQIISGEVALDKLLAKMIKIAIENAGAQKGFMILENNGRYYIEAEGTTESEETMLNSIPLGSHEGLSASIVNYAARTKDILILNDASVEGDFITDPYIQKNKPKSILCAPIINQGKLTGILYLENNLSKGAFTQERLEILNILSSQMAISIENAKFYKNLEDKVRERTEELENTEKRFKDIAYSTGDWIWETNPGGVFTYCSEKVEDILGYKPYEIIGKMAYDLMPKDEVEAPKIIREIVRKRGHFIDIENWYIAKNGRRICNLTFGIPIFNKQGEFVGYRGVNKDITERKQNELKLQEIMQELSRSNKELEQFAYTVSHDLQEPLRKIMTFGDRLKEKNSYNYEEKSTDYINRMQGAAKRMQGLIQGLLNYSRVITKTQPFEKIDLNRIINDVISDLEVRLRDTGGKIETEKLPVIYADPLQMRQLFQNLIVNALKFRRKEESPIIRIYGSGNGGRNYRAVAVEDNGIGIDEKDYDKIFGVFQRLHGRTEYEGYGIGLAICKKIVERHGGKLELESKIGAGTKFIIRMPVE